jgi:hypothetical protein
MLDGETMPDPSQNREFGGHPARDGRRPGQHLIRRIRAVLG